MPMYPTIPATFATRVDGQGIFASHVNDVQNEIQQITEALLNGVPHILKPFTDNARDLGSATRRWKDFYAVTLHGDGSLLTSLPAPTGIVDSQIAALAAIAWSKISKTGSSLADLTTRSASDLSSGTLPDARFPATLPALDGSLLTALNASALASGSVADARLSANVPLLNAANAWTGVQTAANQPRALVLNSTSTQSVANANAVVPLAMASETFDTATMHDNATANTKITIPTGGGGIYLIIGRVWWPNNTTGTQREIHILRNGATLTRFRRPSPLFTAGQTWEIAWIGSASAADYFELAASHDATTSLTLGVADGTLNNSLGVVKIW